MTLQEQESQLKLGLGVNIIISLLLWMGVAGFIAFRLWSLRDVPPLALVQVPTNVPEFKQESLSTLRQSVKAPETETANLPATRPEPFD